MLEDFNSNMVRLKAFKDLKFKPHPSGFQFQYGAIKRIIG